MLDITSSTGLERVSAYWLTQVSSPTVKEYVRSRHDEEHIQAEALHDAERGRPWSQEKLDRERRLSSRTRLYNRLAAKVNKSGPGINLAALAHMKQAPPPPAPDLRGIGINTPPNFYRAGFEAEGPLPQGTRKIAQPYTSAQVEAFRRESPRPAPAGRSNFGFTL